MTSENSLQEPHCVVPITRIKESLLSIAVIASLEEETFKSKLEKYGFLPEETKQQSEE